MSWEFGTSHCYCSPLDNNRCPRSRSRSLAYLSVQFPGSTSVGRPHLVGPADFRIPQQIGIDPVPRRRPAGPGTPVDGPQPHDPHQPLHPLPAHWYPLPIQPGLHPPRPVEGVSRYCRSISLIRAKSSGEAAPLSRLHDNVPSPPTWAVLVARGDVARSPRQPWVRWVVRIPRRKDGGIR